VIPLQRTEDLFLQYQRAHPDASVEVFKAALNKDETADLAAFQDSYCELALEAFRNFTKM